MKNNTIAEKDMEKPCACKICEEIEHTHAEHKDGCPHCEENHPVEECPTRQVTCFLCEGTTHYPAQCHIYPVVHQTIKQQKEAKKEALKESLEDPVMKEDVEDKDEEGPNNFYSNACCMWRRRTFFTILHEGKNRASGMLPDRRSGV